MLSSIVLAALTASLDPVTFYYEERPPLTYTLASGIGGLVGQPAQEAILAAGLTARFVNLPFKRHMALIEQNVERACAIGRFKLPERERLGKYSAPIFRDGIFMLVGRSGDARVTPNSALTALLARPDLRLVLKEGYSYGPTLDTALEKMRARRIDTPDSVSNIGRMVLHEMGDLTFASEEEAKAMVADSNTQLAAYHLADMPAGELRYFYCSKQVDDEVLQRLNAALPRLK